MRKNLSAESSTLSDLTTRVYIAKPPIIIKIIGWACISFFLICTFISLSKGEYFVSVSFLLFVALGAYLILTSGELNMSSDEIISITPIAQYRMPWNEIDTIEVDSKESSLVFFSENRSKRLAVLGPLYWYGPDQQRLSALLSEQIQKYQIPVKQSFFAGYMASKNTRIKSG